jgi:glutamate racemase
MKQLCSPIGIFDSGVGGLKILSALRSAMPRENYVYIFDRSHAPYGKRSPAYVKRRAKKICSYLYQKGVKLIVVACNTATAVAIEDLRSIFDIPIVGIEPPVKAAVENVGGKILVLCTPLTAKQQKLSNLIKSCGENRVDVLSCPNLAFMIENNFADLFSIKDYIKNLLSPYKNKGYEAIVLGCTHYYYVSSIISEVMNGIVCIDAKDGIVKRVKSILDSQNLASSSRHIGTVKYIYL